MTPTTWMLNLKCSGEMTTDYQQVENLTMEKKDFSQIMRLRNQLVIAADNFGNEKKLSPMLIPPMSEDMDEQLKLVHKVIDVVDRANRKVCVTLLRYNVEKPKSS